MTPFIYILGFTLLATCSAFRAGPTYSALSCKELCCDGTSHERNRTTRCCGKEVYDVTLFGCCEDQIVNLPSEYTTNYGCCKNDEGVVNSYSENTHVCCEGQLIAKPKCGVYYQCCGGKLYDYYDEICCNNEVFEKNHEERQACIGDEVKVLDEGTEICGDEIIISEEKLCCQTYTYDHLSETSKTCGKSHDKTEDEPQSCCGIESYNYNTHLCCYSPDGQEVNYVLEKPEDVSDDIYMECCGQDIITNYTYHGCCHDTVYDRDESECCGKTIYDKSEVDDKFCCWNSNEFYDLNSQTCTENGVVENSITNSSDEEEGNEGNDGSCVPPPQYAQYECEEECSSETD